MRRTPTAATALALAMAVGSLVAAEKLPEEKSLRQWIEVLALADAPTPERLEAVRAIARLGPEAEGIEAAVGPLVQVLGDKDPQVRAAAAYTLAALGPVAEPAIPALVAALRDTGHGVLLIDGMPTPVSVWVVAGKALGEVGSAAVPALIAALGDENPQVCVGAAGALHLIGPGAKDAVEPLLRVLARDEAVTRRAAISGLMGIGPAAKAAVPQLTQALTHEDFHTQYWACRALREIGPEAKTAVPVLVRLLDDGVASVRRNAAQALGGIGPDIGEPGLAALAEALDDPIEPVREDAAVALGKLGPFAESAVPALRKSLETGPLAARAPAAKALWLISGKTEFAVDVLIGELDDVLWREQAAEILGEIGPAAKKAVPDLRRLVEDKVADEDARGAAARALEKIEGETKKESTEC